MWAGAAQPRWAAALVGAALLISGCSAAPAPDDSPSALAGTQVDIGDGRSLYVACAGTGSPTIILESGIHDSSEMWIIDEPTPPAVGPDVFTALAEHTRVCRYDRPGTIISGATVGLTDRSTPVAMPRTIGDVAKDLEVLLDAAGLEPPFVLVGHSFGGWLQTYYAQTRPDDVVGLVLVDAFSARMADAMGEHWAAYEPVLNSAGGNPVEDEPEFERFDVEASVALADAADALRQDLPMAVISKTEPFPLPATISGFSSDDLERAWTQVQEGLVGLVPGTPHIIANGSDHYVQVRSPDLVVASVLLVLERAGAASL